MSSIFLPGSTIGVLGSGQLGRMFTLAARRMGYRVHTFSPDSDTPTGQVADVEWTASYDDLDRVHAFARQVDVVTFEFENVPATTVSAIESLVPVHPKGDVLHITQHRFREKSWLDNHGFPVTPFAVIRELGQLPAAVAAVGLPAVIKTAGFGYDGKGQRLITTLQEAEKAFADFAGQQAVLEKWVDFQAEMSVVAARNGRGDFAHFEVVENRHKNHILDVTLSPFACGEAVKKQAIELARGIMEQLQVIGVLCVEMFLTKTGAVLINELAPRPHNSGHYTIDACLTSQFEQQLRAVCGLPLGATHQSRPAAMANLLGDIWEGGEPLWAEMLSFPDIKLHLYGKKNALPGRKMGHVTAVSESLGQAEALVLKAREKLRTI